MSSVTIRNILAAAVKPEGRVRLGDALAAIGRQVGLKDKDFEGFQRDKIPAEPMV
ncbi:hypothetical protein [Photorhabdus khanii]|uniref:hypothetical protein n=1 Tax=Photorhabdus khanii TaxID=1004150 RepID=UPI0018653CF4|nr:hypothetical protein [Photorhabdus khanii]